MDSWKDIHKDFTPKLQKRWESFGFVYEQVKEWIEDYDFSPYDMLTLPFTLEMRSS